MVLSFNTWKSHSVCFDVSVYLIVHRDPFPAECKKLQQRQKQKVNLTYFAPLGLKFHTALFLSCLFRLQILFSMQIIPPLCFSSLPWMYEFHILMSDIVIIFKFSSIILLDYFQHFDVDMFSFSCIESGQSITRHYFSPFCQVLKFSLWIAA